MNTRFPFVTPDQRVGLLGGSFDPVHAGHVHITLQALKRFDLDAIWWLVSPGNPLKSHGPAPLQQRLEAARTLMRHPRVSITGVEAELGTRYTAQTIAALQFQLPKVRFIWLMGADNLQQLHRWHSWTDIMSSVPVGVLARPGLRLTALGSPAARRFAGARLNSGQSHLLGRCEAPAWCFVNIPMTDLSSSAIRAGRLV